MTAAITCPDYVAVEGSRRCRDFLAGGGCARADHHECLEWRKANPLRAPAAVPAASPAVPASGPPSAAPPSETPVGRDLFGARVPAPSAPRKAATESAAPIAVSVEPAFLSAADVASFGQLGAEVCLLSPELGPVWIVPAPTGQDRRELTGEQLAFLVNACTALPGSRVVALDRRR